MKQGACSNPVAELPYSYFAKAGRHGGTPDAVPDPNPMQQRQDMEDYDEPEPDVEMGNHGGWPSWDRATTSRRMRWYPHTTTPLPPPPPPPPGHLLPPHNVPANSNPLIIPAMFDDRYEQLDGNCGGNFLFRNGLRVGCQGCSLEECKQLCSKFESDDGLTSSSNEHYGSRCLGFSFTGRTDVEPRCLLKSMNYCVPSYNTLGYFFYRKVIETRISHGEEAPPNNSTSNFP